MVIKTTDKDGDDVYISINYLFNSNNSGVVTFNGLYPQRDIVLKNVPELGFGDYAFNWSIKNNKIKFIYEDETFILKYTIDKNVEDDHNELSLIGEQFSPCCIEYPTIYIR